MCSLLDRLPSASCLRQIQASRRAQVDLFVCLLAQLAIRVTDKRPIGVWVWEQAGFVAATERHNPCSCRFVLVLHCYRFIITHYWEEFVGFELRHRSSPIQHWAFGLMSAPARSSQTAARSCCFALGLNMFFNLSCSYPSAPADEDRAFPSHTLLPRRVRCAPADQPLVPVGYRSSSALSGNNGRVACDCFRAARAPAVY